MERISCNNIDGSMYGFPRVHFTDNAIAEAKNRNMPVDGMYCLDMVNETGIMTVPGAGFGQKEGTYHFRMTNLVCPTKNLILTLENLKKFNANFHKKYA